LNEEFLTNRIDTPELQSIKNNFAYSSRNNAELYEINQLQKKNPNVVFTQANSARAEQLSSQTLLGLTYPIRLDGAGGLALSNNYDRIEQQILEVLETRIGERVYRPFFGLPELIFETIDEYTLAQSIKAQLQASLPIVPELSVVVKIGEDGSSDLYVWYAVGGLQAQLVKYTFRV
jgi:hypothetical protein